MPTMSALNKGYDILLEKPISNVPEHCLTIAQEARRLGRTVVVCHVLRYTPFYQKIKETIQSGRIGQVVSLHQFEDVGWGHYAHSFVRGLWNNSDNTSPHDPGEMLPRSGHHPLADRRKLPSCLLLWRVDEFPGGKRAGRQRPLLQRRLPGAGILPL